MPTPGPSMEQRQIQKSSNFTCLFYIQIFFLHVDCTIQIPMHFASLLELQNAEALLNTFFNESMCMHMQVCHFVEPSQWLMAHFKSIFLTEQEFHFTKWYVDMIFLYFWPLTWDMTIDFLLIFVGFLKRSLTAFIKICPIWLFWGHKYNKISFKMK